MADETVPIEQWREAARLHVQEQLECQRLRQRVEAARIILTSKRILNPASQVARALAALTSGAAAPEAQPDPNADVLKDLGNIPVGTLEWMRVNGPIPLSNLAVSELARRGIPSARAAAKPAGQRLFVRSWTGCPAALACLHYRKNDGGRARATALCEACSNAAEQPWKEVP